MVEDRDSCSDRAASIFLLLRGYNNNRLLSSKSAIRKFRQRKKCNRSALEKANYSM